MLKKLWETLWNIFICWTDEQYIKRLESKGYTITKKDV